MDGEGADPEEGGIGREVPDLPPDEYQGWTTGNILPYIGYDFIRFEWASPE
jgi:hypothetical protein